MRNRKLQVIMVFMAALGLTFAEASMAASVLDTATNASISAGFTDLKDTVKDVLGTAFPYMLGIIALLAAPGLVKRMIQIAKS